MQAAGEPAEPDKRSPFSGILVILLQLYTFFFQINFQ